jgi:type IV pilus assembly protein PilA
MLKRLRERAGGESGFTLIELLVVMLILGILAAIAIPAFLNQKGKASDSAMKVQARTMQTAMETCSTDNTSGTASGTYLGCDLTKLHSIEATIPNSPASNLPVVTLSGPATAPTGYTVTSQKADSTSNTFSITKLSDGTVTHNCGTGGSGGCPTGGNW